MLTIATVAVAFFAALIAFGQWWTARQKLVLDLFEKRFQVFMDLRSIASEALQLGKIQQHKGLINEVFARSRFLFDDDINDELTKMYSLVGELEVGRPGAAVEVNKQFEKMFPLFLPYLAMRQKLPTLPWDKS
jgi:hypothetical protein